MSTQTHEDSSWWEKYENSLPRGYLEQLRIEHDSTRIMSFNTTAIPGLLQTEPYARAVIYQIGEHLFSKSNREMRVQARMERQKQLFEKPNKTDLHVLLDESALWRQVGSSRILFDQLQHIVELASLTHITLQVLPFTSGAVWPLLSALPFEIFYTDEKNIMSMERSFLDHDNISNDTEITYYSMPFSNLCEQALNERASIAFVKRRIAELEIQLTKTHPPYDKL